MSQLPARVKLALPDGREVEYTVTGSGLSLGRDSANDVTLNDQTVSRNHARLERVADGYTIVDLGSTRGTLVNGSRVQRTALVSGDTIRLGDCAIRFVGPADRDERRGGAEDLYAELGATALDPSSLIVPTVPTAPITANLTVRTTQRTWELPLTQEVFTIGRAPESDVVLDDPAVSRRHARIERRRDAFVILDLKSTNGTWLGLRRVEEYSLHDGDTIRIGSARLAFKRNLSPEELSLFEALVTPEPPTRLEVEIDRDECQKQVDEIVESDFFRDIRAKSRRMRRP